MSQTLSDLVQRTVTRLSMVPGIGVQIYSEDRISEMIYHKFVIVRAELWWDDYMTYVTLTQDENGDPEENVVREMPLVPVGDEIVINKFTDIQYAWAPSRRSPLKTVPRRENPAGYQQSGTTLYLAASSTKVVAFRRITAGMVMSVRYKIFYPYFQPDDIVPMDDQILILGACYDYLEDDGTNPGQTEKFRNMFNDRLSQLMSAENQGDIPLSPGHSPSSDGWITL